MPFYPLNPTAQDTINTMNIHFTAGYNGPTSILSAGPEATAKYEYMIYHPFIIRSSFDYRYGDITSVNFPQGNLHRYTVSAEIMFYRGTDKLTGYFGAGLVHSWFNYNATESELTYYNNLDGTDDISLTSSFGYRITAGLRFSKFYSVEIGITEIKPELLFYEQMDATHFRESREKYRMNDFKVSIGYIFSL